MDKLKTCSECETKYGDMAAVHSGSSAACPKIWCGTCGVWTESVEAFEDRVRDWKEWDGKEDYRGMYARPTPGDWRR